MLISKWYKLRGLADFYNWHLVTSDRAGAPADTCFRLLRSCWFKKNIQYLSPKISGVWWKWNKSSQQQQQQQQLVSVYELVALRHTSKKKAAAQCVDRLLLWCGACSVCSRRTRGSSANLQISSSSTPFELTPRIKQERESPPPFLV